MAHSSLSQSVIFVWQLSNACHAACRPRCAGYFPEVGKVSMSELASTSFGCCTTCSSQMMYECHGCYSWICTVANLSVQQREKDLGRVLKLDVCSCRHGNTGERQPTTRDMPLFSCDDAGPMHLCIFSHCDECERSVSVGLGAGRARQLGVM